MNIKILNGLRGVAALAVLIAHLPRITDTMFGYYFKSFVNYSGLSYLAVDIFFILSGFLITRILLREKEENTFSFKNFYIKRLLRIFPIYYLTIIVVGLTITWDGMGYVALYLSNYFFPFYAESHPMRHTWSLAVEEHFYMVWPMIVYVTTIPFFKNHWKKVTFAFITTSLVLFYIFLPSDIFSSYVHLSTNTRLLSLVCGAVIAYNESKCRSITKIGKFIYISLLSGMLTTVSVYFTWHYDFSPSFVIIRYIFATITSISLFLYILNSENRNNLANKIFTSKILTFFGLISYGIYLYHYPIYHVFGINGTQVDHFIPAGIKMTLIPLAITIVVAIISYYSFEKPILSLRSKLIKK